MSTLCGVCNARHGSLPADTALLSRAPHQTSRQAPTSCVTRPPPGSAHVPCCMRVHCALRAGAVRQARVESWVKEFDLGVADLRTLYLASADLLRASRVCMTRALACDMRADTGPQKGSAHVLHSRRRAAVRVLARYYLHGHAGF